MTLLQHFARNAVTADDLLVLEEADGIEVIDSDGRRHVDALSGLFCAQLGYGHADEMAEAAAAQIRTLPFATNWAVGHPPALALAEALAARSPGDLDSVFLTSGGSESVESAWKLVRQYHQANGEPQRTVAIARDIAYHGVTLGALSLTGVERFKTPFGPPAIETRHVSHTNAFRGPEGEDEAAFCARLLAEVEDTVAEVGPDRVAMIIAEPVQNAGGCLVPPAGYWPGLRAIADRHGILLVADEVICGFGRLGEWFGVERFGAVPDLITCAKGLTSGYAPAGAVLASTKVTDHLYSPGTTLMHGITFGGHPLSCALALKSIEIFEREGVLDNVRALEPHLESSLQSLRDLPIVGDVRGAGFFWAVELVRGGVEHRLDAGERERLLKGYLPGRLLEAGLVARADDRGDSVLQIAPPLVATREELDDIVGRMGDVLTDACAVLGLTPTPV